MSKELTEKEEVFYGNFGWNQECVSCKKDYPIHKYDLFDEKYNKNYIVFNGKEFLCLDCNS